MIRGRSYFKLATKQALGPTGKNGGQAHKRKAKLFPRRPAGIRGNNHDRGLAWQKRPSQKQDHAANTASRGGGTTLAHDVGAGTWRNLSLRSHRAALRGLGLGAFVWVGSGNSAATPTVRSSSNV